ncbi:MAG: hypothetical protein NZM40_09915 [Sphingomonadaceae bacterium]|nr:hypothetical protein [Sphingomonadaceae bacterium]MDW8415060.1 hypothetical protein [Thermaurantiacus sp.]
MLRPVDGKLAMIARAPPYPARQTRDVRRRPTSRPPSAILLQG